MRSVASISRLSRAARPLEGQELQARVVADEKVGDKPAAGIKVTGPDGKDFTLYFDKESGLPVKSVAKVVGFQGDEYTQETTYTTTRNSTGSRRPQRPRPNATARDLSNPRSPSSRSWTRSTPRPFPSRSEEQGHGCSFRPIGFGQAPLAPRVPRRGYHSAFGTQSPAPGEERWQPWSWAAVGSRHGRGQATCGRRERVGQADRFCHHGGAAGRPLNRYKVQEG